MRISDWSSVVCSSDLSRCLKFNLKRLLPEQISGQMRHILGAENISYEDSATGELARAGDGSLRDGRTRAGQGKRVAESVDLGEIRSLTKNKKKQQYWSVIGARPNNPTRPNHTT